MVLSLRLAWMFLRAFLAASLILCPLDRGGNCSRCAGTLFYYLVIFLDLFFIMFTIIAIYLQF
jgi:hypothetical protein